MKCSTHRDRLSSNSRSPPPPGGLPSPPAVEMQEQNAVTAKQDQRTSRHRNGSRPRHNANVMRHKRRPATPPPPRAGHRPGSGIPTNSPANRATAPRSTLKCTGLRTDEGCSGAAPTTGRGRRSVCARARATAQGCAIDVPCAEHTPPAGAQTYPLAPNVTTPVPDTKSWAPGAIVKSLSKATSAAPARGRSCVTRPQHCPVQPPPPPPRPPRSEARHCVALRTPAGHCGRTRGRGHRTTRSTNCTGRVQAALTLEERKRGGESGMY